MPVFNERATVLSAIDDALAAALPVSTREIVVVDDGSTDGTRDVLTGAGLPGNVHLHLHRRNSGKGAAVRTALEHATGDFTAILDADLEYRATDLALLLDPLLRGDANVVFGTRMWSSHAAFSFWYVVGNKAVTFATNLLYNCWISDVMTCHKAMRTELFRSLRAARARVRDRAGDRGARPAGRRAHLRGADQLPGALARRGEEADGRRRPSRPQDARPLQARVEPRARRRRRGRPPSPRPTRTRPGHARAPTSRAGHVAPGRRAGARARRAARPGLGRVRASR